MDKEYKNQMIKHAKLFKAIGHPIRLCILSKLCEQGECNVTYFTNCMDASQSNISQHLAKLRDLDVVETRREGTVVWYRIANEEVRQIIGIINKGD
jgi:DNA-binding transcriptional ArsR family regulator